MVENLVGYAKRDLMIPQAPFTDLTAANQAAASWCTEVNAVTHSEICAIPSERLDTERGVLAELPSLRPSFGARPTARKVDKLSCVRFGSARYSVPNKLIGSTVTLLVSDGQVQVVEPFTGEVLAEHRLVAPGKPASPTTTTDPPDRTSHDAAPEPEPRPRRTSSHSATSRKRSSPALPRPG